MPVKEGSDKRGKYYQGGNKGKKYYYFTKIGKKRAFTLAMKQGKAIKASQNFKKNFIVSFK